MPSDLPQPWRNFLQALDRLLSFDVVLHCLGGFVVTACYGLPRTTADLDVLVLRPFDNTKRLLALAGRGSELHQKHGIYLDFVSVATYPDGYEERLTEVFPGSTKHIRLLVLDPYDLALAKLERNLQRDRDDVMFHAEVVPLDVTVLKKRYEEEMRLYLGRPEREDLTLRLWIEIIEERRNNKRA